MALLAVPHELQFWMERIDPRIRIALDHWDTEAEQYSFHDLSRPDHHGEISPNVLEACYRPVGASGGAGGVTW